MRRALLVLVLAAFSWPALARQDQSQAPAAQNPPQPQVPATAPPPSSQAPAQPSTPAGEQQAPATQAPPSSAKTHKKKKKKTSRQKTSQTKAAKHKKTSATQSRDTDAPDAGPRHIVVRRGGTSDTGGQLEPGVPASDAAHQRQTTEQLLQATDSNLKNIARRKLTPDQQDMVRQITFYMQQSRSADQEGDLGRARNLAMKAHMLSDALARQ